MQTRVLAACPLVLAGLGSALAAQQTLTVGPGQTYTTLLAAITAAAPGDTVLVLGGSHGDVYDIDKPLRIVGAGGTIHGSGFNGFRVHDLAAGEAFVLRGLNLDNPIPAVIEITRCAGPVTVHDLDNPGGLTGWALAVVDSPQVQVARVRLNSSTATGSVVAYEQCVFDPPASFLPTLDATNSSLSLVHCSLRGTYFVGMAALRLTGSSAAITRSSLLGTTAGGLAEPAITASGSSVLLVDPSTTLSTQTPGPTVVGTVPLVVMFPSLRASSDGAVLSAEAHGPGGQIFATYFSDLAPATATPFGLTWLDLGTFAPLYIGILDPTTRLHLATIAHAPQPAGLTLAMQTVGLGPDGLVLGQPTVVSFP